MKNILYMIDTTGPGGAETLFIDLTKHFIKDNNNGLAIIHGSGWVENQLIENNIKYVTLKGKGSFNFIYLFHLIRLIFKHKIQVIHAHLFGSNIYASLAGLLTNTPVISTFHGLVDISTSDKLLNQKISIVKKGSTIIAVSQKIHDHLIDSTTLTTDDILIVPNGIHLKEPVASNQQQLREQYDIPQSSTIIGCLGNVRPAKDYETAINTVLSLSKSNIDVVLLIAGATNHELYDYYQELIHKHDLTTQIKFIGFIKDPYLFLSNLDIYLMTSTSEGQPISLFQAMSSRLPIVGTRCGIEDVLEDGESAWLSPIKSEKLLAEHIISILNDPNEAKRRADNAKTYVITHFNIESMFKNYDELYNKLTKN